MTDVAARVANKPAWIDLSTSDAEASRAFYASVFGWKVEVSPDPQYGGYAIAKVGDTDVAGIGPKMMPEAPTAWMIYIGTDDTDGLAATVKAGGGTVIMDPFDVGDQGRMAVFQDPTGAFISAWQRKGMGSFLTNAANSFGWAELNSRGFGKAVPFYKHAFGWTHVERPMGEGQPPYTEFQVDGAGIAGGMEMNPMVPANVPSYWMVYFTVDDVEASFRKVIAAGGQGMLAPQEFPGGRFAIVSDPQGAVFGLHALSRQS